LQGNDTQAGCQIFMGVVCVIAGANTATSGKCWWQTLRFSIFLRILKFVRSKKSKWGINQSKVKILNVNSHKEFRVLRMMWKTDLQFDHALNI